MKKNEQALILFSGGKDSFLSTLLTLEKVNKVNLVTFLNGMELRNENTLIGANRIQKKYGSEKVNVIGIKNTDAIWREIICEFYNWDTEYITSHFGNITISQFNCLSCRVAMYILSIIICYQNNIKYVVDGARKSQLFTIEQPIFLDKFKEMFKEYNIVIEYPLVDEEDDFIVKNQIMARGFVPKMNEMQCLLGMPMKEQVSCEILNGLCNVFDKYIYPKSKEIIKRYLNAQLGGDYL